MRIKSLMLLSSTILAALLSVAGSARQAQDPAVLLRAATEIEEVDGDLRGAIASYEEILAKYAGNRAVAAKAQLRIGICYEKLGSREAQNAYQKVIDRYPDQAEAVRTAEKSLSRLTRSRAPVENANELKLTKIYTGNDYVDSISPDGQKLALIRDDEIWVKDIKTGKEDSLTTDQNTNWNTLWSPDSQRIAFVGSDGNIKVISVRGGSPGMLARAEQTPESEGMTPTSWSPDGSKIMFHVPSRGLYAVPITGGDWQEILVFPDPHEANKYQSMILSPNGQWIAYAAVAGGNTDIYVMPCGGGEPVRVTSNPAVDRRPIWSYDGKRLAFASYGTGNPQIWTVGISSEGKPEGVPAQVTRENQVLGGNWTLDGRIGFPTAFRIQHIFTANPDGSDEIQLTQFPFGNYEPRWSPGGETILFGSDYLRSVNTFRLWTVPSKGGEPKLVRDASDGIWTSDGKKIIFPHRKALNESSIMIVNATGADPEEISSIHGEVGGLHLSPDGSAVLFTYEVRPAKYKDGMDYMRQRLSGIGIVSVTGGEPRTIIGADKEGLWYPCARWSPDGRKIALMLYDDGRHGKGESYSIWTMDADGGNRRLITKGGEYRLCWSPDGNDIVYETRIEGMAFELYKISVEGGQPERMNIRGRSAEFSPDGKRLAYSRWIGGGYEFWLAENIVK